jgi:drug/metabolite transporter (DMT)-like permease
MNGIRQVASRFSGKAPHIAMVIITMIWGSTFLLVQHGLTASSPMFFVGCRFAAAAIAVGLISIKALKKVTRTDLFAALAIGLSITLGYGSQTIGLQSITSSESAFLTALYVPLVPLILLLIFRKIPRFMSWIGVITAFIGLLFLSGNGFDSISFNFGQQITIFGAIPIATEIILISHFAPRVNLRCVTVLQLVFASLFAFLSMPLVGETTIPPFSMTLLVLTVGLGLASALIQTTMNWAQREVEPSTAAVIYAGEPVWAGIFGRLMGEILPPLALVGGALVVVSILISEYRPRRKRVKQELMS